MNILTIDKSSLFLKDFLLKSEFFVDKIEPVVIHNPYGEINKGLVDKIILLSPAFSFREALYMNRTIRKITDSPILILTRRPGGEQISEALNSGADDIISWPADMKELEIRIKKMIQRSLKMNFKETSICLNAFNLNIKNRKATLAGKPLNLTKTEYKILLYLLLHQGQITPKEHISKYLSFTEKIDESHSLNMHIWNLRKKIGPAFRIITMGNKGYIIKKIN